MSNRFIRPIDRTLSDATIAGQNEPGSDEASLSDCQLTYPGNSLGKSYPSEEMLSVDSAALSRLGHSYLWPTDWTLAGTTSRVRENMKVMAMMDTLPSLNSKISGSPSDDLVSDQDTLWEEGCSYPSEKVLWKYSTAPDSRGKIFWAELLFYFASLSARFWIC